jgi:hypothetical protein
VLIDLPLYEIVKKYKVSRDQPLPASKKDPWTKPGNIDLASYERQYPKSLFNKGVRTQDEEHIGHVMKETDDKIVKVDRNAPLPTGEPVENLTE